MLGGRRYWYNQIIYGQMKFNDHKVKIGSRRLYCTLEDTKRLTDIVTKETYPELSEEEIHE